ncbi:UNVERIFIED_CONTAM: protein CHROMATIN REMODELING 35 [Sesamum radiatum]|uniref:Protein CHROMATIN REMODELING 35 n=1 Tax=Sesamum radiatum TaxID=300843 RepID=A0AAW2MUS8_SESRA
MYFLSASWRLESDQRRNWTNSLVVDHSDPFSINNLLEELDSGKYGSVTKDIKELLMRRRQLVDSLYAVDPELPSACLDVQNKMAPKTTELAAPNVIDIDDDQDASSDAVQCFYPATLQLNNAGPVVIIDSDDDDPMGQNWRPPYLEVNLKKPSGTLLMKDFVDWNFVRNQSSREADAYVGDEAEPTHSGGVTETIKIKCNTLLMMINLLNLGTLAVLEPDVSNNFFCTSQDAAEDAALDEYDAGDEEECEHSFILKDDIGDVCRICGVIRRGIEKIIEYNFSKGTRSTRTYRYEGRTTRELDQTEIFPDGLKLSDSDFTAAEIYPHPRHRKEMKPHQIEGFNFLLSNLVTDNPGGCIMAHAPGSGKTFMIISFLQSFMAKYPGARPLVVLPRGILAIWKKEFLRWQVEDIPLYDFYSVKADSRLQQLEVLKEWVKERSILFLGYKQFSSIICDTDDGQVAVACQNYLLKVPTILILDEGHTPRNQDTDVLTSLERVETARKVVLSGTLYQNHVKEVFNILNLVRPKFLKMETSKAIRRRILSRAEISSRRNLMKHGRENEFYELIEHTLIKDENHMRKVTVIQDLREMTRKVLHYYKGDNLDELPGLVDFAVFLRLSPWQKSEVKELTKSLARKFTISAQGSAIYVHPKLKALAKNSGVKDRVDEEKIDVVMEKLDVKEGAKLNFYLNLLQLCESSAEKLLVFSQYLLPLKFLERMTAKVKGYSVGREMFMITGDSDAETRESSMEKFNCSPDARVFFGSIRACGEGISLVGASRIIILDVHLNPSVTRQAIGRAFRPGQLKKVYTYRLIASGSPEEVDHITCFKKESIAKMWFEWDQCSGHQNPEMETVDVNNCGDIFLETARLNEDVISVSKR